MSTTTGRCTVVVCAVAAATTCAGSEASSGSFAAHGAATTNPVVRWRRGNTRSRIHCAARAS